MLFAKDILIIFPDIGKYFHNTHIFSSSALSVGSGSDSSTNIVGEEFLLFIRTTAIVTEDMQRIIIIQEMPEIQQISSPLNNEPHFSKCKMLASEKTINGR